MSTLATLEMIVNDFIAKPHERIKTTVLNDLIPEYARIQETVKASRVKADRIQRDRDRSDEGKKKANASLATEDAKNYSFIGGQRTKLATRVANLRAMNYGFLDLPEESDPTKALIRELRAQELRASYNGKDNRGTIFLEAIEQGNVELAHAFLNAPGGSWVSREIKQQGAEAYAQRNTPKEYEELQNALVVQEHLDMLAEEVRQVFTTMGGDPEVIAKVLKVQEAGASK